jgi:hypothetical protein
LPDKVWHWEKFFDEKDIESAPQEIKTIIQKLPQERSEEESKQLIEHFKKNDAPISLSVNKSMTCDENAPD